jgi:hypothetical protein
VGRPWRPWRTLFFASERHYACRLHFHCATVPGRLKYGFSPGHGRRAASVCMACPRVVRRVALPSADLQLACQFQLSRGPNDPAARVERFSGPRRARVRLTLRSTVTLVENTSAGSALPVLALVSVRDVWSVLPESTSPRDYRVSSLVDLTGRPARQGVGPHVMGHPHGVADLQFVCGVVEQDAASAGRQED